MVLWWCRGALVLLTWASYSSGKTISMQKSVFRFWNNMLPTSPKSTKDPGLLDNNNQSDKNGTTFPSKTSRIGLLSSLTLTLLLKDNKMLHSGKHALSFFLKMFVCYYIQYYLNYSQNMVPFLSLNIWGACHVPLCITCLWGVQIIVFCFYLFILNCISLCEMCLDISLCLCK